MPSIRAAMADGDANRTVEGLAEQMIARTGASYVVVIDRHQIRHSHPIPSRP
jgi:two-component system, CitB family, sensor kinase